MALLRSFFRKEFAWKFNTQTKALIAYGVVIFALLFAMVALSGTTHIKERWLQPYLVIVPLFLFSQVVNIDIKLSRRFIILSLIAPIIVASVVLVRPWLIDVRGKPTRASYPFEQVTYAMKDKLSHIERNLIYAEDKYIGGNLKLFFPEATVITPSLPNQPYELSKNIILFWETEKPSAFIEILTTSGYICEEYHQSIAFQKSKKLFYEAMMMLCKKEE